LREEKKLDLIEAIKTRKSIRAFKTDPIPKVVLEDILKTATLSPSAANLQPWEFLVITGEPLKKLSTAFIEKSKAGEVGNWELRKGMGRAQVPEKYLARMRNLQTRNTIYQRDDPEQRAEFMRRGFRFFGAPAVIIVTMEKTLGDAHVFDLGLVTQTLCLAALNHGLGTCIQAQGVSYPNVIREMFNIPESKIMAVAVAIGYPDFSNLANQYKSGREPLEELVTWIGF
jgi:nitroreductase